jgi:hypothetical protein
MRRWYQYSSSFWAARTALDIATGADRVRSEYEIFDDV